MDSLTGKQESGMERQKLWPKTKSITGAEDMRQRSEQDGLATEELRSSTAGTSLSNEKEESGSE